MYIKNVCVRHHHICTHAPIDWAWYKAHTYTAGQLVERQPYLTHSRDPSLTQRVPHSHSALFFNKTKRRPVSPARLSDDSTQTAAPIFHAHPQAHACGHMLSNTNTNVSSQHAAAHTSITPQQQQLASEWVQHANSGWQQLQGSRNTAPAAALSWLLLSPTCNHQHNARVHYTCASTHTAALNHLAHMRQPGVPSNPPQRCQCSTTVCWQQPN